jgi:hypothetical protein
MGTAILKSLHQCRDSLLKPTQSELSQDVDLTTQQSQRSPVIMRHSTVIANPMAAAIISSRVGIQRARLPQPVTSQARLPCNIRLVAPRLDLAASCTSLGSATPVRRHGAAKSQIEETAG